MATPRQRHQKHDREKRFNICKPQVQGASLSTWGVVRREFFRLPGLTKASRAAQNRRG